MIWTGKGVGEGDMDRKGVWRRVIWTGKGVGEGDMDRKGGGGGGG